MLTIIFHIVGDGGVYKELDASYYDQQNKQETTRRLIWRLQRLGCYVN
jgi:hypothetical protein